MAKLTYIRPADIAVSPDAQPGDVPGAQSSARAVDGMSARSRHPDLPGRPSLPGRHGTQGRHARAADARAADARAADARAADARAADARGADARAADARAADARLNRPALSIRSAEDRRWSADLSGSGPAGLVICGMGGIGKSTLARQIGARVCRRQAGRVVSVVSGEVSAATFEAEPAETDFIICDNFDDNLSQESGQASVRDPALATALANWTGKLLITCRRPFTLLRPDEGQPWPRLHRPGIERLTFRQLGPLTWSGAAELTASLPAVRLLDDAARDRAWRLTAGHPLAMGYLDSLLAEGEAFTDIADRTEAMIQARTGQPLPRTEPTELSEATAAMIASAAGEQMFGALFDGLSPGARDLLVRASVFRVPVPAAVLAGRPGQIAECETAGLLVAGPGSELSVHRWTAEQLQRRLAEAGRGIQLAAAHQHAAGSWQARAAASPAALRVEVEASYHHARASQAHKPQAVAVAPSSSGRHRRVVRLGVAGAVAVVAAILSVEVALSGSGPHLASANVSAQTAAPVSEAVTVRDQAAVWAARQVSAGAIMACDPAMCTALVRRGVPAGNLLPLGSAAADPLGSDVILATAAVRGLFGSRLASVYAPEVLASFGAGPTRIDIRAVASDGASAYRAALAADLRAREIAGHQLAGDLRIALTPSARWQLATGQVDARLLLTLATLAAGEQVRIAAFTDDNPGASAGMPLRAVELFATGAGARRILAFFRAQRPPYLPAVVASAPGPGGESIVTVQFAAPSPLGLLQAPPSSR